MSVLEQIIWRPVAVELPDAETTVMINAPELDEPVWLGWYEDGVWHDVASHVIEGVTHWAEMPKGARP